MQPIVIGEFGARQHIKLTPDATRTINQLVVTEYMNEFLAGTRTGVGHFGAQAWSPNNLNNAPAN